MSSGWISNTNHSPIKRRVGGINYLLTAFMLAVLTCCITTAMSGSTNGHLLAPDKTDAYLSTTLRDAIFNCNIVKVCF